MESYVSLSRKSLNTMSYEKANTLVNLLMKSIGRNEVRYWKNNFQDFKQEIR